MVVWPQPAHSEQSQHVFYAASQLDKHVSRLATPAINNGRCCMYSTAWQHQAVKIDFTADLNGSRNQSEEILKW